MSQSMVSLPIEDVIVGASSSRPILDQANVLLLGAHTRITDHVLNGLRERGISHIEVDPRDVATLKGGKRARPRSAEKRISKAEILKRPLKDSLVDRYDEALDPQREEKIRLVLASSSQQIETVRKKLSNETLRSVSALVGLSETHADVLMDDYDHTVGLFGRACEGEDLAQRSARMSVLGMAVASEMGFSTRKSSEVGLTGLLHDLGLMVMEPSLRQPYDWMTDNERWEYQKHPLVAAACVNNMMEVSLNVSLAMTQIHEQFNGTGFPRGLQKTRIHPYARILNVVDSYLQLTSPSDHRPAIVPHDAMAFLLHQAANGMYDPKVIRAFLKTETLFPLGSEVELSSGEVATVIRRPRDGYSAPVVAYSDGNRVELEREPIEIVRPIVPAGSEAIRMDQEMMRCLEWTPMQPFALPCHS